MGGIGAGPALDGLNEQGYYRLSPPERAALDAGLRFAPAVMLAGTLAGLVLRSPAVHGVLAAIALASFLLPAHHPLDLLYNHAVRRLTGGPALPPNPLPRRLAGLAAAAMSLVICLAFSAGRDALAYGAGAVLVALQLGLVARQLCGVSWLLARLARWRQRPAGGMIDGERARGLVARGAQLVDVRSPREFSHGHLPGAINVPVGEIAERADELLELHRPLVLYCTAGVRCADAANRLRAAGAEVHELGKMSRWPAPPGAEATAS